MIRVLLVGVGGMGSCHLDCWRRMDDVQVAGICDVFPGRAKEKALPGEAVFTDMDDALNALTDIDIVDIATPSYLHRELSCKSLSRGIHTVCEKPLALSKADGEAVFSEAEKAGVFFMTAQVVRFMKPYLALREIVKENRFGNVLRGRFTRVSGTPEWSWENWMKDEGKSGGVPFDLSIHDVDYIVSVFGAPDRVEKTRSVYREDGRLTDAYRADLYYANACISAEAGWYSGKMPFSATFCVVFEQAVVLFDGTALHIYHATGESEEVDLTNDSNAISGINITSGDGYFEELSYFKRCVQTNTPPTAVPKEEVLCVLSLAEH